MTTTNNKKIVHEYKCATIVDRVELNKLNSEKLASVMSEVFSTGKQVLIIENVQTFLRIRNSFRFFSSTTRLKWRLTIRRLSLVSWNFVRS
jgi:hypothetical protein